MVEGINYRYRTGVTWRVLPPRFRPVEDGVEAAPPIRHVKRAQLSPLGALRDRLGSSFVAGITFYTGATGYEADDRIHVLPIERLWT